MIVVNSFSFAGVFYNSAMQLVCFDMSKFYIRFVREQMQQMRFGY